ncbi:MAG: DUF4328 domain-containing protein [Actinobacteria bacterium]|nr:DUF4328 domain-containing protein [Actinomycetota bacterium]
MAIVLYICFYSDMDTRSQPGKVIGQKQAFFASGGWQSKLLLTVLAIYSIATIVASMSILAGSGPSAATLGDDLFSVGSFEIDKDATPEEIRAQTSEHTRKIFQKVRYDMSPHSFYDWFQKVVAPLLGFTLITAYCIWFYRASSNLVALQVQGTRFSPVWAVLGNIIPVANIILPYLILTEIWKASTPDTGSSWQIGKRLMMIDIWFALRLAALPAGIVSVASMYLSQSLHTRVILVSSVLLVGECIMGMLIVRAVDRRQLTRFAAIAA